MWRVVKITSELFLICRDIHLKGVNVITPRWKWFQINVLNLLVVFNSKKYIPSHTHTHKLMLLQYYTHNILLENRWIIC